MAVDFSAEAHYESKIKHGSIKNQSQIIKFDGHVPVPKQVIAEKGLRRICKDQFDFSCFIEINKHHCEYLRKIKDLCGSKAFLDNIYKAELTGAKIRISNKIGFVIEERRNSLVVIFEGNVLKLFPKKTFNFTILFDDVEYMFFSKNLKKGRCFKN